MTLKYFCGYVAVVQDQPGEEQAVSGEWQQRAELWDQESAADKDRIWTQEEKGGGPAAGVYDQDHWGGASKGRAGWSLKQTPGQYRHQYYTSKVLQYFVLFEWGRMSSMSFVHICYCIRLSWTTFLFCWRRRRRKESNWPRKSKTWTANCKTLRSDTKQPGVEKCSGKKNKV